MDELRNEIPENTPENPLEEAGSIGDEQNPAYVKKTDKQDWDQSASRAKRPGLSDKIQQLEEGE